MEFIRRIYHKYADTKLFTILNDMYMNGFFFANIYANYKVRKIAQKRNDHILPIKVAFICQQIEAWNKLRSVFEKMLEDKRFEVVLIALEPDEEIGQGNVYSLLKKLYGKYVINGSDEMQSFDLKGWKPDYVFSNNPYDQYFPKKYRSGTIAAYAKNCYVDYGFSLSVTTLKVVLEKKYFRNIYLFFAENDFVAEYNKKRYKRAHRCGDRKTLTIGYPSFEFFYKQRISKEDDRFTIVWTPRWTEDKKLGGSNFLNFKDQFLDFSLKYHDIRFIFRPHPMTFEHFISIGKITREEVDKYLDYFRKNDVREYDKQPDFAESFWKSDILVTDYSSVMIEYFLTGKPIIYCDTGAVLNPIVKEMCNGFYIANNWNEVEMLIKQLKEGNDPLGELRKEIRVKLFGDDYETISQRFLDALYDDFKHIG